MCHFTCFDNSKSQDTITVAFCDLQLKTTVKAVISFYLNLRLVFRNNE